MTLGDTVYPQIYKPTLDFPNHAVIIPTQLYQPKPH